MKLKKMGRQHGNMRQGESRVEENQGKAGWMNKDAALMGEKRC